MKQPTCEECGSKWIDMHARWNWSYVCNECGLRVYIPKDYKQPKIKPYVKRPIRKLIWRLKKLFNT